MWLSLAFAIVGFLIVPIFFGPFAVIFGIVAVALKRPLGWLGIILGVVEFVFAIVMINNALNSFSSI